LNKPGVELPPHAVEAGGAYAGNGVRLQLDDKWEAGCDCPNGFRL